MTPRWTRTDRGLSRADYLTALRWRANRAADLAARAVDFGFEDSAVFWGGEADRLSAQLAALEPVEESDPPS